MARTAPRAGLPGLRGAPEKDRQIWRREGLRRTAAGDRDIALGAAVLAFAVWAVRRERAQLT